MMVYLQIIPNFYPPFEEKVKIGIFSSLKHILEKRVLSSLHPLFDSPKLDQELRIKIRDTFKGFCLSANSDSGKSCIYYWIFIISKSLANQL